MSRIGNVYKLRNTEQTFTLIDIMYSNTVAQLTDHCGLYIYQPIDTLDNRFELLASSPIPDAPSVTHSCQDNKKEYVGFTQRFIYCSVCDGRMES